MNRIRIKTSKVYERMDALMLTQAELAEIIRVTPNGLDNILTRGTCYPTIIGRLAKVLGIKVWELVA